MPPAALAAKSPSSVPIACNHEQEADVPERNGDDGPALQHDGSRFVGPKPGERILSHERMSENIAVPGRRGRLSSRRGGTELPPTSRGRRKAPASAGVLPIPRVRLRSRLFSRQHAVFKRQVEPLPYLEQGLGERIDQCVFV